MFGAIKGDFDLIKFMSQKLLYIFLRESHKGLSGDILSTLGFAGVAELAQRSHRHRPLE